MRVTTFVALVAFLLVPLTSMSADFTPTGAGGGGWLHGGAILPTDSDVIVIGTDVSGVYRTDDFGDSWYSWTEGMTNPDELRTNEIQDLLGVDYDGWTGFYAATLAGIYRAEPNGDWECTTPTSDYCYVRYNGYAYGIPFSCLDWTGDNLIVAGAGALWWKSLYSGSVEYENSMYPGDFEACGDVDGQWTVWTLDLDGVDPSWEPDITSTFGAARDISVAVIDNVTYMAVGTHSGIYVKGAGGWSSVCESLYEDSLACWSLHLTQRGALYAAMRKTSAEWSNCEESYGIYRLFDVTNPAGWSWVGDGTDLLPYNKSVVEIGSTYVELILMSVVDGQDTNPDLLYLAARNANKPRGYGLFRGYQAHHADSLCHWKHKVYSDSLGCYYRDSADAQQDLAVGWVDEAAALIFEPVVSDAFPDVVVMHLGDRLHISDDRGDSWQQCYTEEVSSDCWQFTGYSEVGVLDVAFLSDGRAVESTIDHGLFRSCDDDLDSWEHPKPYVNGGADPESDAAWNPETGRFAVRTDWMGLGDEVLFVISGDGSGPTKLFLVNGDDTWTNITGGLASDSLHFYDLAFSDDSTCFMSYRKYDGRAGTSAGTKEFGVLKGTYRDSEWSWDTWNDGLVAVTSPENVNAIGVAIIYHEPSARLFLAARQCNVYLADSETTVSVTGALYMLPAPDSTTWYVEFGGAGTRCMDFRSLAQSADGEVVYAGTGGRSWAGIGTLLKCSDPNSSARTWTPLANVTNYPFGFAVPFWADWEDTTANQRLTDIRALAVDPNDPDVVYVGLFANCAFLDRAGLWKYDSGKLFNKWKYLSSGEDFEALTIRSLAITPTSATSCLLLVGTHGKDLYYDERTTAQQWEMSTGKTSGLRLLAVVPKAGGRTEIALSLDRPSRLEMKIYDVTGRLVRSHDAGHHEAGQCRLVWDGRTGHGRSCASGIYFLRVTAGRQVVGRKFLLIR